MDCAFKGPFVAGRNKPGPGGVLRDIGPLFIVGLGRAHDMIEKTLLPVWCRHTVLAPMPGQGVLERFHPVRKSDAIGVETHEEMEVVRHQYVATGISTVSGATAAEFHEGRMCFWCGQQGTALMGAKGEKIQRAFLENNLQSVQARLAHRCWSAVIDRRYNPPGAVVWGLSAGASVAAGGGPRSA